MNDQEIMDLWNEHRVNGPFTVSAAVLTFARDLLSASIADTAGAKPVAWAIPVEIEHLQKGYRNSAVICNRNEGAYTLPVYLATASTECTASPSGHPCNRGKDHEGPCGISECSVPPSGWSCTRAAGHAGPCAAIRKEI